MKGMIRSESICAQHSKEMICLWSVSSFDHGQGLKACAYCQIDGTDKRTKVMIV